VTLSNSVSLGPLSVTVSQSCLVFDDLDGHGSTIWVFCRTFLNWDLPDVFLVIRLELSFFVCLF
jgi:hypothetical protein